MVRRIVTGFLFALAGPGAVAAQTPDAEVRAAVAEYNRAMVAKDLPALKALLAPEIVLYEHSVRNIGLDDVWEHHLRPEVSAFENMRAEFTDVRVSATSDMALVTRQYSIQAIMNGRPIDAKGNETMGWARRDGAWRVTHIHYSHPCPRLPAPPGQAANDSGEVAGTVERFHAALEAGDSAAALGLLADDVVILESGGAETRDEYRAGHLPADIAFAKAVPSRRESMNVRVRGEAAWASAIRTTQGEYRGRQVNSRGVELIVLSREPGGWRIRAIHWSSRAIRQGG